MISTTRTDPGRRRLIFRLRLACLIAAALASILSSTAIAASSSTGAHAPVMLVLGDSISAEYGLQRDTGWVKLLDGRLHARNYDYEIVNASISGETTSGGLARIDELMTRVKPSIVVVELGGNDALCGLSLAATEKNLDAIVERSRAGDASVLIVGMQIPPNYGKTYAERFAALYPAVANRHKTALTPFFFAGFADHDEFFQPDRIHPTAAAQIRLLDNVWPDLLPLLKRR